MERFARVARDGLRWSACWALPGVLWAAFEMYGLTMRGQQMLFFMIAHVMPPLVLAVWLAVPAGALWLAQSLVALVWRRYRNMVQLRVVGAATFVIVLSLQAMLLAKYDDWSSSDVLRLPLCTVGLAATLFLLFESWRSLRNTK